MNGDKRGVALFFNFENFGDPKNRRHGAKEDARKLEKLFTNMELQYVLHSDLTKETVLNKLEEFTDRKDLKNVGLLFVVFASHGKNGVIITSDGSELDLEHEVYPLFSNSKCPQLIGTPKVCVVNACRGPIVDKGVAVEFEAKPSGSLEEGSKIVDYKPVYSDFFILYSSAPFFISLRNKYEGSWLITAFVEQMSKSAHCEEWKDICTRILTQVGAMQGSTKKHNLVKQSPEAVQRGPHKRLFFNLPPGFNSKVQNFTKLTTTIVL